MPRHHIFVDAIEVVGKIQQLAHIVVLDRAAGTRQEAQTPRHLTPSTLARHLINTAVFLHHLEQLVQINLAASNMRPSHVLSPGFPELSPLLAPFVPAELLSPMNPFLSVCAFHTGFLPIG